MLSKKCQYALHALKFIAQQPAGKVLTIQEIAENRNIPREFLEVILADLKISGILESKKGKFGYYLNRASSEVNILEVVRLIDGAVSVIPCVSLHFYQSCG